MATLGQRRGVLGGCGGNGCRLARNLRYGGEADCEYQADRGTQLKQCTRHSPSKRKRADAGGTASAPEFIRPLEVELQRELDLPCGLRVACQTEGCTWEANRRSPQLDIVKGIQEVAPELEVPGFGHVEGLHQPDVSIGVPGSSAGTFRRASAKGS